jgi:hypothetical protein
MKNVCLNIVVQTPRSLSTRERVGAFCDTLRAIDPYFVPHKFGPAEPLRSIFNLGKAEEQIADLHRLNGGSMIFAFKPPLDGLMHFNAARGQRVPSNGLKVQMNYAELVTRLDDIQAFIKLMFGSLGAAYACATLSGGSPHVVHVDDPKKNWGEINGIEVPPWNPTGLQSLPGICWINVFGPEYVRFIGEDVLASLPAQALSDRSGFWLQPTERPEDMLTHSGRALAADIKNRIGKPLAFYGHDPSTPSFRATYDAPPFDFSEIRPSTPPA